MWIGLVLTCFAGTEFRNVDNCALYQSPTIIVGDVEDCVNSVNSFLSDEMFNLNLRASGMEVYNIKCVDVIGVGDIQV
jgi:hypothetical protein